MQFADDIAHVLEDDGVGDRAASSGWAIFVGREPSAPEHAPVTTITLRNTDAVDPPETNLPGDNPGCQARIRANDYTTARDKAIEVKEALIGRGSFVGESGDEYLVIFATSDVAHIGYDDRDRPLFTINFGARVERPDQTHRKATDNTI